MNGRNADAVRKFDAATFDGFHCYDVDFSHRAARAGHRVGIRGDFALVHESLGAVDAKWRACAARLVAKFPAHNGPQGPSHRYEVALGAPEPALAFFRRLESIVRARLAAMEGRR